MISRLLTHRKRRKVYLELREAIRRYTFWTIVYVKLVLSYGFLLRSGTTSWDAIVVLCRVMSSSSNTFFFLIILVIWYCFRNKEFWNFSLFFLQNVITQNERNHMIEGILALHKKNYSHLRINILLALILHILSIRIPIFLVLPKWSWLYISPCKVLFHLLVGQSQLKPKCKLDLKSTENWYRLNVKLPKIFLFLSFDMWSLYHPPKCL